MYKYYIPGAKTSRATERLINYGSKLNKSCICDTNDDNKVKKDATDYNKLNISNMQRAANLIKLNGNRSTVQFGNDYLGYRPIINYLGRVEGQPGGFGSPPRNSFI